MNRDKPCNTCRFLSTVDCGGRLCEDNNFEGYEKIMGTQKNYKEVLKELDKNLSIPISKKSALDTQVGGSHYKQFAIQPFEFITKNSLGFAQGNIIKYICRYKEKNGLEDLKKVKHYVDMLIEIEYNEQENN